MATTTDADGNPLIYETVVVYFTADGDAATVIASSSSTTTDEIRPSSTPVTPVSSATSIPVSSVTVSSTSITSPSEISTSTILKTSAVSIIPTITSSASVSVALSSAEEIVPTSSSSIWLPIVTTGLPASSTSTFWSSTSSASAAAATTSSAISSTHSDSHKQAVVGGLAGAMGGTVFLAVLLILCFCDRRKRKDSSDSEKQAREQRPPMLANEHSFFGPIPYLAGNKRASAKSFRTADGNVIKIDLDNFSRPFGEKEGWRDSVSPRRLRVMNPDKSLPGTPSVASDRVLGFFGRQNSSPRISVPQRVVYADRAGAAKLPVIHINETSSPEHIVSSHSAAQKTPSQKSYSSVHSTPVVRQQPPDDPFQDGLKSNCPGISRQGTSGRGRTIIGNALTAFRSSQSVLQAQQQHRSASSSMSMYSPASSERVSNVSDPFELESPYMRQQPRFIMQQGPRFPQTTVVRTCEVP